MLIFILELAVMECVQKIEIIAKKGNYPVLQRQKEHTKGLTYYNKFIKELPNKEKTKVPFCFQRQIGKFTPSQERNVNFINSFLTSGRYKTEQLLYGCIAPGGSGKSILLRKTASLLDERNINYSVVSYTAVSARHCQGTTIHSFLNLQYAASGGPEALPSLPISQKFREKCRNLEFLLIDEIGFLNSEFINLINKRLQLAKNNNLDFGGVNILAYGDFHQLPPIFPVALYSDQESDKPFTEEGRQLFKKFKLFTLEENVRAGGDPAFQDFCMRVRNRELTQQDIELLRKRQMNNLSSEERLRFHESLHIFPTNSSVYSFNLVKLMQLGKPIVKVTPKVRKGEGTLPITENLYLTDNCPVVLTKNLNFTYNLINGTKGRVHSIYYKKGNSPIDSLPSVVFVKFDSYEGPSCENEEKLIPIVPLYHTFFDPKLRQTIHYTTLPLRLGFASTVHNVQSQTLSHYVIHFDKREYFLGQTYVSLSRGSSFSSFAVFDEDLPESRFIAPNLCSQYEKFKKQLKSLNYIQSSATLKRKVENSIDSNNKHLCVEGCQKGSSHAYV